MAEQFDYNQFSPLPFPTIQMGEGETRGERRDAAQHRQHILQTARTLFTEHGVDNVSMHQVARAAGVGQGTLYRRYAHKGLLCTALLNAGIIAFQERLLAYLEQTGEQIGALERLYAVLVQMLQFNESNAPLLSAITDAACGERRSSQYASPFYRWLRQVVVLLLQRAVEREEITVFDIEYAADIALLPSAIDFYLYQRQLPGFTSERIAAGLRQFLFSGLNPQS
jgi:AcrR family transcriptional regulator